MIRSLGPDLRPRALKYPSRHLHKVLVVAPLDSVHQDLVGGQNTLSEDWKCIGEQPEQLLGVQGSVLGHRYDQKSPISRSHIWRGGGAFAKCPPLLWRCLLGYFNHLTEAISPSLQILQSECATYR